MVQTYIRKLMSALVRSDKNRKLIVKTRARTITKLYIS